MRERNYFSSKQNCYPTAATIEIANTCAKFILPQDWLDQQLGIH